MVAQKADVVVEIDLELARRVVSGDRVAVERFVEAHYEPTVRLLRNLCGDLDDAQDLAQATFVRAQRELRSYRGGARLSTWLYRVAFRVYLRWRRSRRLTVLLQPTMPHPDRSLAAVDDRCVIEDALRKLPPAAREALVLTEHEGLRVEEAAAILGVPAGTVKSRAHAARTALRRSLATTYGTPTGGGEGHE